MDKPVCLECGQILLKFCQRVPRKSKLADDVLRHLALYAVYDACLALGRLEQLVELFWVKFQALEQAGGPGHNQQQLFY